MIEPVFQMPLRVQIGEEPLLPGFVPCRGGKLGDVVPRLSVSELHCTCLPMGQAHTSLLEWNKVLVMGGRIDILVQDGQLVAKNMLEAMEADRPFALDLSKGLLYEKQVGRHMNGAGFHRVERIVLEGDDRLYMIGYKYMDYDEEGKEKEAEDCR